MKRFRTPKITERVYVDNFDDVEYYLYRIDNHFVSVEEDENGKVNITKTPYIYEKKDFTKRELEIANYLFKFIWDSENGTNTECECDIYEDDGFTRKEIENFINNFDFYENGVLEMYDDGGIEIYIDYCTYFDLRCINGF